MYQEFIIRARGLPYSISKGEIESFFNTSQLKSNTNESIHITYNDEGRPSGECYVEFADEDSYHNAMRMNREYLGSRYLEVFDSDSNDMHRALSRGSADKTTYGADDEPVVKLRGLPFSATEEDIRTFFDGLEIPDLKLLKKSSGEPKGDAYVRFVSQEHATVALTKHMEKMDWRYIEVFKATDNEMRFEMGLDSKKPSRGPRPAPGTGIQGRRGPPMEGEHRILMRGIPFQASQGDVIKFFAPLLPRHIELIEEVGGRPSGQAYTYFNCHEDAELAMEKDKDYMGERYVELFLESVPDPVMPPPGHMGVMPPRPRGPNPHMDPNMGPPQPIRKRLMAGAPPKQYGLEEDDQEFYSNERRAKKPKMSGGPPKQRLLPGPPSQQPPPPGSGPYQDPYASAGYGGTYAQQDPYTAQQTQYAGTTEGYTTGAGYPGMGINQYADQQYTQGYGGAAGGYQAEAGYNSSQQQQGYGQMGGVHPSRAGF